MHTRRCNVLGSALGASFLVILGRFWGGRWRGRGLVRRPDTKRPSRPVIERALDGLGSWWVASGGVVLGKFKNHAEADEPVTVARVGSLRR